MSGVRNLEDESYDVSVYLQRARERKKREEDAKTSRARSRALLTARETSLARQGVSTRSFVSTEMVGEREVKRGEGFTGEHVHAARLAGVHGPPEQRNHLANAGIAMRGAIVGQPGEAAFRQAREEH